MGRHLGCESDGADSTVAESGRCRVQRPDGTERHLHQRGRQRTARPAEQYFRDERLAGGRGQRRCRSDRRPAGAGNDAHGDLRRSLVGDVASWCRSLQRSAVDDRVPARGSRGQLVPAGGDRHGHLPWERPADELRRLR